MTIGRPREDGRMKKHRLHEMSWMEAQEAFRKSDTVIMPVGTLHAHGPTPIGIDASSVEALADEVGRGTGPRPPPPLCNGGKEKMREYPASITIVRGPLEAFYT